MDSFSAQLGKFTSPYLGIGLVLVVGVGIGLTSLFILHSVSLWLSTDPVRAFHLARTYAGYFSSGWNSLRSVWNASMRVAFFWVPQWNTFAMHTVQPVVYIGLDVMSQIFAGKHYAGVLNDVHTPAGQQVLPGNVEFRGHYCGDVVRNEEGTIIDSGVGLTSATRKWCAFSNIDQWAQELGVTSSSDPTNMVSNGSSILLSTAHARRLQSLFGEESEGGSMFGALNLGPLLEGVKEITGFIAMITTTYTDIVMHVVFTVLSEMAIVIWNALQIIIRAVASVVMSLVNSGALQTILKAGLDLLMTLVVYVAIPGLLAVLDLVMCMVNFVQPGTWSKQLECGALSHPNPNPADPNPDPLSIARSTLHAPRSSLLAPGGSGEDLFHGRRRRRCGNLYRVLVDSRHRAAAQRGDGGAHQPFDGAKVRRGGRGRLRGARGRLRHRAGGRCRHVRLVLHVQGGFSALEPS